MVGRTSGRRYCQNAEWHSPHSYATAENAPVITSISIGAATTQISRRTLTRPSPDKDAKRIPLSSSGLTFAGWFVKGGSRRM